MRSREILEDILDRRNSDARLQRWWAWYPVTIKDRRVWLRTVYRKKQWTRAFSGEWHWHYTDNIFDVLIEIK